MSKKITYIVIHETGATIDGLERSQQISTRDEETGKITTYAKNFHAQFDTFEIEESKLEEANYNRYIASLEANKVIARKNAEYENAELLTLKEAKGRYMLVHPTIEAKNEVSDYYLSLLTQEEIDKDIEATTPAPLGTKKIEAIDKQIKN
ncbi:MAG: hypothetical protein ACRCZ2_10030 [Fusobacteriaceae bacterium]